MGNCQNNCLNQQITSQETPQQIRVLSSTWEKDSHGLFDYEAKNLVRNKLTIQNNAAKRLVRKDCNVYLKNGDQKLEDQEQSLCNFEQSKIGVYNLVANTASSRQDNDNTISNIDQQPLQPWIVVRSVQNQSVHGMRVKENDIIKLGRVKIKVVEIREKKEEVNQTLTNQQNQFRKSLNLFNEQTEELTDADEQQTFKCSSELSKNLIICRICLSDQCDKDNQFVSPCKCTGTMKYVHIKCLQSWVFSKNNSNPAHQNTSIFIQKNIECELCKVKYPSRFKSDGQIYDLVDLQKPKNSPYIVLELLCTTNKNNQFGHSILTVGEKQDFEIGRSHDCILRIQDISVSRLHAILHYDKGNLYLKDLKAKFGSLVLLQQPLPITEDLNQLQLQFGRTLIQFQFRNNTNCMKLFNCFNQSSDSEQDQIEEQPENLQ